MKSRSVRHLGMTLLRSVLLFFAVAALALLSRTVFESNLFDEEMLSPRAVAGWNFAFLLLIYESMVFTFNRHATASAKRFLEAYTPVERFGKLKRVLLSVDFYIELACIALLSCLFPLSGGPYECVGMVLRGPDCGKAQALALILPIFLVLSVIAHLSVRSAWISDSVRVTSVKEKPAGSRAEGKKKEQPVLLRAVKGILITAAAYCAASLVIPWMLPFIVTVGNLGVGALTFLYIALVLAAVILAVVAGYYARAMSKRRDFVRKLRTYCREHAISLSDIRNPYTSLLFAREGPDFTLEHKGNVYDCKLVAGVFPGSPMVFSDEGRGILQSSFRLFGVRLLQVNTLIDYRMDSRPEGSKKIIIVLPIPQKIYASVGGCSPRPADTGEALGEYTLYNAVGFLHALERDVLR